MKLEHYLEIGAIELAGVDKDGEIIYQINDIAKEIAPELWQSHEDYVNNALVELYEEGLISVEYDEDLEATISISKEGYEKAKMYGIIDPEIENEF